MKLHANAALSLIQRSADGRLCLELGGRAADADGGGRGGRSQCPLRAQVGCPLPGRGRAGSAGSLLGAVSDPASHQPAARRGDPRAATSAVHRRGDRGVPEHGALDRLRGPEALGDGQARPPGSQEPAHRYERERPGELIHIDVKKLGRIVGGAGHRVIGSPGQRKAAGTRTDAAGVERKQVGWEYVHIAIDDTTRLAYAEVLTDERGPTAVGFLHRAVALLRAPRHHRAGCAHRQRQRRHLGRARPRLPGAVGSSTSALVLAARRPMARPSASSARCSPAGPTERSTATAPNVPQPVTAGSATTTITDDTQPSATNRPSLASTSGPTFLGPTSRDNRCRRRDSDTRTAPSPLVARDLSGPRTLRRSALPIAGAKTPM